MNLLALVGLVAQRLEQRTHNLTLTTDAHCIVNHLATIRSSILVCFGAIFWGFGTILGPSFGTQINPLIHPLFTAAMLARAPARKARKSSPRTPTRILTTNVSNKAGNLLSLKS